MIFKRLTALLLCGILLMQTAVFADAGSDEDEEIPNPVYTLLLELEDSFAGGGLSLKNGAGESEEPETYTRSSDAREKRGLTPLFGSAEDKPGPGFHIVKGHVVYVKEDGSLARNEIIDGVEFNIAGSRTSGDSEFDAMLAWIFDTAGIAKYEFGSEEQLHELFRWEVNNMGYKKSTFIDPGEHGWELERGKALLLEGKGNCYMFAGLFYELSRAIGYNPAAYSGWITYEKRPHGWVEIEIDGTVYIFDTEICYQQLYFEKNYSANLYMQTNEQLKGWVYKKADADITK